MTTSPSLPKHRKPAPSRAAGPKPSLRKTIFHFHVFAGLALGLFLLVASLTGVILAFRTEIDERLNPSLYFVEPGDAAKPLDELTAQARMALPKVKLEYAEFSGETDQTVKYRFLTKRHAEVYVNPYTAEVVGRRDYDDSFVYITEKIHRYLFLGKKGQFITAFAALALLLMLGTGIYLWIPKTWAKLWDAITFNRKHKGRALKVQIHKVTGIYGAAILAVLAITGAGIAFPRLRNILYYFPTGSAADAKPPKSEKPLPGAPQVSMEQAWQSARALIPDFQVARYYFPQRKNDPISIYLVAADAPHNNALSYVYLDAHSGKQLRFDPYDKESLGHRLYLWTIPLHTGAVGGFGGQLVVVAGALCLAGLVVTGGWMYYRRKINPIKRAVPVPARPEPARPQAPPIAAPEL